MAWNSAVKLFSTLVLFLVQRPWSPTPVFCLQYSAAINLHSNPRLPFHTIMGG